MKTIIDQLSGKLEIAEQVDAIIHLDEELVELFTTAPALCVFGTIFSHVGLDMEIIFVIFFSALPPPLNPANSLSNRRVIFS